MIRFWTADMHLGHNNIIKYCGRPFRDCNHMNECLINDANMRVKNSTCIHVGDFCTRGGEKARDWHARLCGNWVFLRGNHDKNNGVKTLGDWLFTRMSHYSVFVSHIPYFHTEVRGTAKYLLPPDLVRVVESTCDFSICGHVHEHWKVSRDGAIPCYNVGVDQWNFMPVREDELLELHRKETGHG